MSEAQPPAVPNVAAHEEPLIDTVINFVHQHISPYLMGAWLVLATSLNSVTAYLFTASFLLWLNFGLAKIVLVLYRRGVIHWIKDTINYYRKLVWRHMLELKDLYWVKVLLSITVAFEVGSISLWSYHHLDVLKLLVDTLAFIRKIPMLLFDSRLLILEIHVWLNRVFLSHLVAFLRHRWEHIQRVIINHPSLGVVYILGGFLLVTLIIVAARQYKSWVPDPVLRLFRVSVLRAEESDRQLAAEREAAASAPRPREASEARSRRGRASAVQQQVEAAAS